MGILQLFTLLGALACSFTESDQHLIACMVHEMDCQGCQTILRAFESMGDFMINVSQDLERAFIS